MSFNDIRIPRVPDETFKEIKRLAKKDGIYIHQKALQLIKLGLSCLIPEIDIEERKKLMEDMINDGRCAVEMSKGGFKYKDHRKIFASDSTLDTKKLRKKKK